MRLYYPRSFPRLLAVGFTLIAAPLIFALISTAVSVDQLASRSHVAVYQAVQATQSGRQLAEVLTALERTARQMVILGDRSLVETYELNRQQFGRTVDAFARLPLDEEQKGALEDIVSGEEEIFRALTEARPKGGQLKSAMERFVVLGARAQTIVARSNALIDREVEAMRATADQAQRITFWQLLALVPVVAFLVIGFTILIARPIRQIDLAIRRLGGGEFNAPVAVSGPQDLEHLGERLEWMRRRLVDLEQQKNRFLRHVSHELKTPLTALREGAELLSDEVVGNLTPQQREIAEILRHNSIELQKLIEDLLSYGASQFHKVNLDLRPVSVRQVINRVADDQRLALRARALKLEIAGQDVSVRADFEKLRVVLDNLMSNAVKFSPRGATIRVETARDGTELALDVRDEGPGIAREDRERIFDPFYQGGRTGEGPLRGTGVGLSVVKEYVDAHRGRVEVLDSEHGAHLRVRLPLAPEGAEA
ncbi:MAG: HAMP domain-containing protein [Betaproteobacteria bacterium]|nr:HAMP domain-containing protein [Betaproteobacteria bacterium]